MSTIYTRATKGSALTWTEGDANITNLNNDKLENVVEDLTPQLGGNLDVNGNSIVSTSNANINLTPNGTGRVVISGQSFPAGSTPITGTVTDVDAVRTPNTVTLSNFAGINSNDIIVFTGTGVTSLSLSVGVDYKIWAPVGGGAFELALASGGGNISITDPGTITDVNYSVAGAGATVGQVLSYGSGGNLSWITPASGGSGTANFSFTMDTITSTGAISLVPNSANNVIIDGLTWPATDGTNNQVLKTDGAGNLTWTTISSGISSLSQDTNPVLGAALNTSGYNLYTTNNANIGLAPNGTGKVVLSGLSFPNADGTANQVLKTDGAGTLSWTTPSSGGATTLDELSDVVITAAATNDMLVYNGTNWVDTSAPSVNSSLNGFTTTVTASGTTTLTNTSSVYQQFTGTSPQFIKLPDTSTLAQGWSFHIVSNVAVNSLTLQTSTGLNVIGSIPPGTTVMATCISTADNTVASWEAGFTDFSTLTGSGSVVLNASPTISAATLSGATTSTGSLGLKDIRETVFNIGNSSTNILTPSAANGSIQTITATGNFTLSAFTSPVSGQTITFIITQDATGSRTLTSTMKFAGGVKTLSTAANSIDILTVSYIGTTYYASLSKGFA